MIVALTVPNISSIYPTFRPFGLRGALSLAFKVNASSLHDFKSFIIYYYYYYYYYYKASLTTNLKEYMEKIDCLDFHPKNKILIYQKYVLSKISWDLTVSKISITWIKENLDNIVNKYVRSWLEIPISGTLKITTLSKRNFGLNFTSVSSRFTQCQFTFRKALKTSKNNNIK